LREFCSYFDRLPRRAGNCTQGASGRDLRIVRAFAFKVQRISRPLSYRYQDSGLATEHCCFTAGRKTLRRERQEPWTDLPDLGSRARLDALYRAIFKL